MEFNFYESPTSAMKKKWLIWRIKLQVLTLPFMVNTPCTKQEQVSWSWIWRRIHTDVYISNKLNNRCDHLLVRPSYWVIIWNGRKFWLIEKTPTLQSNHHSAISNKLFSLDSVNSLDINNVKTMITSTI